MSVVTLQRPERLNAISGALLVDLIAALQAAQSEPATRSIVFTGAGRAFCAGDDLKEIDEQAESPETIAEHCARIQEVTRAIMFGPKLVIGAVHGYAVGGGFEWLLNCDLVVASEDLVCFFPEMDWGQFVTGGVTWLLPQAVGHQRAMELWLLGERQSAADLLRLGLANWVVPPERVLARAFEVAAVVASKSRGSVSRLKRVVTMQAQSNLAVALELEQEATVAAFATPDAAERVLKFGRRA